MQAAITDEVPSYAGQLSGAMGERIRTAVQLAALKKFCKHVFVDPEKAERVDPRPPPAQFSIRGSTKYPEKATVEVEIRPAIEAYAKSAASVGELLQPLSRPGGVLEAKTVKESVTRLADSVVRNPDAMLLVTRLREQSAEVHARALQVSIYMLVFARFLELRRDELELLGLLGLAAVPVAG